MKLIHKISFLLLVVFGVFAIFQISTRHTSSPSVHNYQKPVDLLGPVEDFTLWDHRGVAHQLSLYSDAKAIVLFSYSIGCPIVRLANTTMENLRRRYEPEGVKFFYIDANHQDNREKLSKEAEAYGINTPILMDEAQLVTRALGTNRTAEAIVINPQTGKIIYRGAVDNQFTYETQKEKATENYLSSALDSVLLGEPVAISQMPVKGCLIHIESINQRVSYIKDVAPLFTKRCLSCHHTGGAAPWAMSDYESIRKWGPMIRETVRTRRMPPRSLDQHYLKMKGSDWLSPLEAKNLVDWVELGMPRGKGEDPLPEIENKLSTTEWPWGVPDIIVRQPTVAEIPATGWVDWQWDYLNDALDEDIWIKAIYFKPSNLDATHHASIYSISHCEETKTERNACVENEFQRDMGRYALVDISSSQDPWVAQTGEPTNPSEGKPKNPTAPLPEQNEKEGMMSLSQFLGGYNRGLQVQPFPEGTGKFVAKDNVLRFIAHYKTTGKPEQNYNEVGIYLHKSKPKTLLHHVFIQANDFFMPAGERDVKYSGEYVLKENILLHGSGPHLHNRGRSMKLEAELPNGNIQTLWSDPDFNYDFSMWELRYEKPVPLPAGTVLKFEGVFDNSEANPKNPDPNRDVSFGFQLYDEMFWVMLVYSVE